jgi:hypothetical protein
LNKYPGVMSWSTFASHAAVRATSWFDPHRVLHAVDCREKSFRMQTININGEDHTVDAPPDMPLRNAAPARCISTACRYARA